MPRNSDDPIAGRRPGAAAWMAHLSAGLGLLCFLGVLCFHFPEILTSRDFRAVYSEAFARQALLLGLVAAFVLGTAAMWCDGPKKLAMIGLSTASVSVLLGGSAIHFDPIDATAYSLGLDWFVVSLLLSSLVFIPMERSWPVQTQSPLRPEWQTDLGYYFIGHLLVQFILIAATTSAAVMDFWVASETLKDGIRGLPVWVQFGLAVITADAAQAGLHRLYHRVPLLWRFHSVHHSSRTMDWLAGSRMHLVEMILTRSMVLLPLVVLGFSTDAVNAYVVLAGVQAVLAHANLRAPFGWLEFILVTPRYHHWHHARRADFVDVNYAIHLPVIDMLMGTFKRPPAGEWPTEYGVMKLGSVPDGLLAQTWMPFQKRRNKRIPTEADR